MVLQLGPTDTAGQAPAGSASRSPLPIFVALCLSFSVLLHAEPLAAAAELHLQPGVVAGVALSVAALFNLAILCLNFRVARRLAAGGARQLLHPTATARAAPVPAASPSRSQLALFMGLCLAMGATLHAEQLVDAATAYQIHQAVVVCVILSVAAVFNWAVLTLNFRVARRPTAAGSRLLQPTETAGAAPTGSAPPRYPLAPFVGLCLAMSAALQAEQLVAVAEEYQIHPAAVVAVVLASTALFHLAILSINKSLARYQAEDEPKQPRRSRGLPLLPLVVLALAIPTASCAETVIAAGATDFPKDASIWALLALAVSFNIAIGSLYCFVIIGTTPPTTASVKMRPRSEATGAIVSCITAAAVVSCLLLAGGVVYVLEPNLATKTGLCTQFLHFFRKVLEILVYEVANSFVEVLLFFIGEAFFN
ncbi:hypothetical protein BAE44_0002063 [Dichanthelium oligosanthes]|uniref:Uncharacterized protein n=1 Tax=Dichanthelium oligosanthes TaxID=888268 RepID=A0A1E5WHS7_9POAL|nr:hypothetical protein BAE44_0002063 [Dichanthelium oligosanthes]